MWVTLKSKGGGIAVAVYETVYSGPSEEYAQQRAREASAQNPGAFVYVAHFVDKYFSQVKTETTRSPL